MVLEKNLSLGKFDDCTAAIIAGGAATRMNGLPKGLIKIHGRSILAHLKSVLTSLFPRTIIICNDPTTYASYRLETFPDVIADKGAPGGVHAALSHASTEWIFAVACDMPFIYPNAVHWIGSHRSSTFDAVVAAHRGRIEALHAFYRTTTFPAFDAALRAGSPDFRDILRFVRTKTLKEHDLLAVALPVRTFWNINTPDDLTKATKK